MRPGTEATTDQMRERPEVTYPTEPDTLYTVMMLDVSIEVEGMEGAQYIHWIVENVPGTMVRMLTKNKHKEILVSTRLILVTR